MQHHDASGHAASPATVILFTDGLVERHDHPIDHGLAALAQLAAQHADQPPQHLCRTLIDGRPSDESDDTAILALRPPP